jgi:hypothetical protein
VRSSADRERAARLASQVPPGTRIAFKAAKRSLPQNDKLWAMLTDISRQVDWYGQKLTPDDWKIIFTASLRKANVVPGIDSGTLVPLGMSTSSMSKAEFGDLLDLIHAFAAERGIDLQDEVAA